MTPLFYILVGFVFLSVAAGLGVLLWAWSRLQKEVDAGCPSSEEVFDPRDEMTDAQ